MKKLNVLVLFEYSGVVAAQFLNAGHNALSCDLRPTEKNVPHFQGDVYEILFKEKKDIIILHPPCTALSVSGNHVYAKGKPKHQERLNAIAWTEKLFWDCVKMSRAVCLENPIGVLTRNTNLPKPQIVQPYDFGENASKKTALYLYNLPKLKGTKRFPGRKVHCNGGIFERWANQTDSGQNKLGPSKTRAKERAKTYPGIARAMCSQWSKLI